ncbi:MAG: hypothetical protein GX442_14470 [Candidatus Riflebacteria bacterium]|nr:hypothetical protein [Candidatus Riflebacteria bacterium]
MMKRSVFKTPICILLSLLMLLDYAVFNVPPAKALDKKSVLIGAGVGAAAGAGIALAAPAIAGAVGAAGGIAGIGTAIVGGLAAVGGGLLGVVGAVGAAIASGIGAIGGFIVGIIGSPLFIPALIVIAAVAVGIYLYRRHKKKQQADSPVIPGSDDIMVTTGDYDMNPVFNPTAPDQITIGDEDTLSISGEQVTISDTPPSVSVPADNTNSETTPVVIGEADGSSSDLEAAHKAYIVAYNEYTQLVTTGGSGDVKTALAKYKAAYNKYMTLKASAGK